jgi:peroxiredoxin
MAQRVWRKSALLIGLMLISGLVISCSATVTPVVQKDYDWSQMDKICVVDVSDLDRSREISRILTHQLFEMGFPVTRRQVKSVLELYDLGREEQADVVAYGYIRKARTHIEKTISGQRRIKEIELSLHFMETSSQNCIWRGLGYLEEEAEVKDQHIIEETLATMMAQVIHPSDLRPYEYEGVPLLKVGDQAPLFEVQDVEGHSYSMEEQLRDNIIVMGFWYFLCRPCKRTLEVFDGIDRFYQSKGVSVVAISLEGEPMLSRIKSYIFQERLRFTFIMDPLAQEGYEISDPYKVAGIPSVYVVNRSGIVIFSKPGPVTFGELAEVIEAELAREKLETAVRNMDHAEPEIARAAMGLAGESKPWVR